jgi:hypothetical protein
LPDGGAFVERDGLSSIASVSGARGAFARVFDDQVWLLLVDALPDASAQWQGRWRETARQHAEGVALLRARR